MKKHISFNFSHGTVDGIYYEAVDTRSPLVIITNGSNGFYNYGMFPYIQETLWKNGISSYSYNFSHGGIVGENDVFTELDLYEKNCMRLETEDLCEIVRNLKDSGISFSEKNKLILLSHSLGGIPTVFAAKKLLEEGNHIDGIILVSSVKSLDRWPPDAIDEWEKTGVRFVKNNRTKQDLPLGKEFLEEVKEANGKWSMQEALKYVKTNFLIIHGADDEAVSVNDSVKIKEWINNPHHEVALKKISNAGHTFGTKHPFAGTTPELESLIQHCVEWIRSIDSGVKH